MERFLFAPIGIMAGLLAGQISKKTFDLVWGRVSGEEAPEPNQREVSWARLVAALAIQGAIFRLGRGVVDRGARAGFQRLTGSWPGEQRPEPT